MATSGVPLTGPRRHVPAPSPAAASLGAAWAQYRQTQAYGDDELSNASSSREANAQAQSAASGSARPQHQAASASAAASSVPDLREFSQAAVASLTQDYEKGRGKGQQVQVEGGYPEDLAQAMSILSVGPTFPLYHSVCLHALLRCMSRR